MAGIKLGGRLKSSVCTTEVVTVRAPKDASIEIFCGGEPMVSGDAPANPEDAPATGLDGGTLLGKRYVDEDLGIEVLCSKAGAGSLQVEGRGMTLKDAKALPSSD